MVRSRLVARAGPGACARRRRSSDSTGLRACAEDSRDSVPERPGRHHGTDCVLELYGPLGPEEIERLRKIDARDWRALSVLSADTWSLASMSLLPFPVRYVTLLRLIRSTDRVPLLLRARHARARRRDRDLAGVDGLESYVTAPASAKWFNDGQTRYLGGDSERRPRRRARPWSAQSATCASTSPSWACASDTRSCCCYSSDGRSAGTGPDATSSTRRDGPHSMRSRRPLEALIRERSALDEELYALGHRSSSRSSSCVRPGLCGRPVHPRNGRRAPQSATRS